MISSNPDYRLRRSASGISGSAPAHAESSYPAGSPENIDPSIWWSALGFRGSAPNSQRNMNEEYQSASDNDVQKNPRQHI